MFFMIKNISPWTEGEHKKVFNVQISLQNKELLSPEAAWRSLEANVIMVNTIDSPNGKLTYCFEFFNIFTMLIRTQKDI